jgi:hypothetical protein
MQFTGSTLKSVIPSGCRYPAKGAFDAGVAFQIQLALTEFDAGTVFRTMGGDELIDAIHGRPAKDAGRAQGQIPLPAEGAGKDVFLGETLSVEIQPPRAVDI